MRKGDKLSAVLWDQRLVSGSYPDAPPGLPPFDAAKIWPLVEERLGYGVGKRRVRYLIYTHGSTKTKPVIFHPPEWWDVATVQDAVESVGDDGEPNGKLTYLDAKQRRGGGYPLRYGRVLVVEADINGPDVGIAEAARYALTWAERQPRSARG